MPVQDFLRTFLPKPDNAPKHDPLPPTYFQEVYGNVYYETILGRGKASRMMDESAMYRPFIDCMYGLKLTSLKFVDTSSRPDQGRASKGLKPDVSVYREESSSRSAKFSDMELFVEFKAELDEDPFQVISPKSAKSKRKAGFVKNTELARASFGQITSYAAAHLSSSFRTHAFSVLVTADRARFIRWDRAGAIVSEPVKYSEDPALFAEFFRRFDQLTPEQRGHDMTVSVPTADELEKAQSGLSPGKDPGESEEEHQMCCNKFLDQEFLKFTVQNDTCTEPSYFVGTFPSHSAESLVGRASRGCAVFDLQRECVCYLKDTWRIDSNVLPREGEIYKILAKHNVPYIAPLVDEGDVSNVKTTVSAYDLRVSCESASSPHSSGLSAREEFNTSHRTITQLFDDKQWAHRGDSRRKMHCYVHYRLVLGVVGRDLSGFKSTKEMITAIKDAIIAHGAAYEAGILHSDISVGNIMISRDGRGLLIDWDLAKPLDEGGGTRFGRTGTWQFISAALLRNPTTKQHTYADDLESFLHVTTYMCLLYTKSSYSPEAVSQYMSIFEEAAVVGTDEGVATGGDKKLSALLNGGYIPRELSFPDRPNLATLLRHVSQLFFFLYAVFSEREPARASESGRLRIQRMRGDFKAQKEEEIASLNKWTGGGGMEIVELFERALKEEGAWPTADGPQRAIASTRTTLSELVTYRKVVAQVKSLEFRSEQGVFCPTVTSMPEGAHVLTCESLDLRSLNEYGLNLPRKRCRMELTASQPPLE
ncbi:hypothetical protein M0805_003317 [Coniferiporia weirii]|nr:hypothetical protein M0805_003317 [Coniferiporia weirii]